MFLAAEITREQLFLTLRQDLPYVVQVRTESWEKFFNGSLKIQQTIEVLRPSQKAIIIGKSGTMLRHLSMAARKEMEKFFACRIHLFIFVRVHDWIRENNFIPIDFSKYCSYSGER
jgi:GTP-binding protein Era